MKLALGPRVFDHEADLIATHLSEGRQAVARDTQRAFVRAGGDWVALADKPTVDALTVDVQAVTSDVATVDSAVGALTVEVAAKQDMSEKGQPGGYADLDESAVMPTTRIGGIPPLRRRLANDFANATTTYQPIGMQAQLQAGLVHSIEVLLFALVPVEGAKFRLVASGTSTGRALALIADTPTTFASLVQTGGFPMNFDTTTGPGSVTPLRINADITPPTMDGLVELHAAASITGATVRVFSGSYALLYAK